MKWIIISWTDHIPELFKLKIYSEENKIVNKVDELKEELKQAIKEERYEDAAKLRDEIKNLENGQEE